MCQGGEVSACSTVPTWELKENGEMWRLAVDVSGGNPEVDLSPDALRLRMSPDSSPVLLALPEHAVPLDPDSAVCKFSRKARQLVIQWPRSRDTSDSKGSETDTTATSLSANSSDVDDTDREEVQEQDEKVQEQDEARKDDSEPVKEDADSQSEADAAQEVEVEVLSAEEWRTRGNASVKSGDIEEAFRCYSQGLKVGGGDVALLHSNRSLCLHKLGREEEAVEDAKRCVALRPDFVKGYLRGAVALRALGNFEDALAFLKRCPANDEAAALVSELKPQAEAAEKDRISSLSGSEREKEEGNALFKKGLFEAASEKYSRALDLCEDSESALALALRNNRAACAHQLSDFSSVVKDATFVLHREPENLKALMRRMLAYEPLEKYEAALEDARAILRQDARNEVANKVQHRLGKLVRDLQRGA
eukprot:TRINITY_DN6801_c0_g1_i2.p1 TRINITY_DN6801_c0_g1~~TRINITY_DN6801_c0_g1_i2.p1  ORF type:complete len:421 (+),score=108.54 TRINITY_DN6801_c0_g1_i2:126-1388(+)